MDVKTCDELKEAVAAGGWGGVGWAEHGGGRGREGGGGGPWSEWGHAGCGLARSSPTPSPLPTPHRPPATPSLSRPARRQVGARRLGGE